MDSFREFLYHNRGILIGALSGILLAILFLTIGFFPTLLLAVLGGIGAFIGAVPDIRSAIKNWILGLFTRR